MPNIKISELSAPIAVTDSDLIPGVQSGVTRRLTWGGLKSTLAGALGRSYLGLGTAAVANVTTSATDTTVGRVTKVGDFGLGASGPSITDANSIPLGAAGTYSLNTPFTNSPTGGFVSIIQYTHGGACSQVAVNQGTSAPRMFIRGFSGTWGAWQEVATMQKFADEFGSSLAANGYQKLPSGLIIQWVTAASVAGGESSGSWPIAFPNAILNAVCTQFFTAVPTAYAAIGACTKSAFSGRTSTGGAGQTIKFIAIGY